MSGSARPRGPDRRRAREGLHQRRHGGHRGDQPPAPDRPERRRYPTSVALMVGETNAAIEGALAAGATDILVNDSHWNMYNLLPAELHPSARVLQGQKAWSMVAGARPDGGRSAVVRRRPVRRLPRPGRAPERDDRPHLLRHAGRDPPRRPTDRRVRDERARPRRVGHPGRHGRRRRRAGRGGRGLAAVGRAGRRQDDRWRPQRDVVPSDGRARPRPRGRASGPSGAPPPASSRHARGERRSSSRSTSRAGSSPTTPRSCPAPSGSATGPSGSLMTIPRPPSADSSRSCAWSSRSVADRAIDKLAERAETLAGAWGARARASTTLGQERALLRLFGVTGLDRSGRPLAGAAVDRWLTSAQDGLGGGIALPFAMALPEYDLEPQQLALDVASGAVDLALEAELLREPERRATAVAEADAAGRRRRRADRRRPDRPARAPGPARRGTATVDRHDARRTGPRRGARRGCGARIGRLRLAPGRGPDRPRARRSDAIGRRRAAGMAPEGRSWRPLEGRAIWTEQTLRPRAASARSPASVAPPTGSPPSAAATSASGPRSRRSACRRGRSSRPSSGSTSSRPTRRRDRGRRRRSGPLAGRPRVRPTAASTRGHVRLDRTGAARRGPGPRLWRALRSGDAVGPGARAAAARRGARARRWPIERPDRRRRVSGLAGRRAVGRGPRPRRGRRPPGALPGPHHAVRRAGRERLDGGPGAAWPYIVAAALARTGPSALLMRRSHPDMAQRRATLVPRRGPRPRSPASRPGGRSTASPRTTRPRWSLPR